MYNQLYNVEATFKCIIFQKSVHKPQCYYMHYMHTLSQLSSWCLQKSLHGEQKGQPDNRSCINQRHLSQQENHSQQLPSKREETNWQGNKRTKKLFKCFNGMLLVYNINLLLLCIVQPDSTTARLSADFHAAATALLLELIRLVFNSG